MASQSKPDKIVIHYTATQKDAVVTVDTIDKWHKARGWKGIGYHYVIYQDGSTHKGRDESDIGAHVKGHNTGSIGICYVGGLDGDVNVGKDTRTPAQTASMIRLIDDIMERHPSIMRVVGHRDLNPTQCPGFDVASWWQSVVMGIPTPPQIPSTPDLPVVTPGIEEDPDRPNFFVRFIKAIKWLIDRIQGKN